ncbi:MAG TPA: OadG family protein [Oscillospiraceae bacterium]|nr:OadG family protein [Oscillospiraceae bacterium]HPS33702.1 OadG family protein [Oscillospiraceae bacterium]
MSVFESIGDALFLMAVVFAVLLGLYVCIKLFSLVMSKIGGTKNKDSAAPENK